MDKKNKSLNYLYTGILNNAFLRGKKITQCNCAFVLSEMYHGDSINPAVLFS